ncbi:inorganic phosphate transporter [Orrella sp. 11846]|uniref:inorganic phosphate transporter n=1 Tax=Orrella sp. 11846 TaxID=3409913 RepID=UPI003B5930AB
MQLSNFSQGTKRARRARWEFFRLGIGLIFIVSIMIYATLGIGLTGERGVLLVVAAMIGGYMAMNIGANDVANNVGPAVGSNAIGLAGAVVLAATFEVAGALIGGADVVQTIRGDIIDESLIPDADHFIWMMTASLLAGALWLNFATAVGAPVSTTHAIVGAVLGAGLAAGGLEAANWDVVLNIVVSWVVSPVAGGLIAAGFLFWIKRAITYQQDMVQAARKTVPILIGLMGFAFATYLILKGLHHIMDLTFALALVAGVIVGFIVWYAMRFAIARQTVDMENTKESINSLFNYPLVFAAALLSFAHGANDVANAIGPLAAIADTVSGMADSGHASIPSWVMWIGALGIALGLALWGPKLIKTVGGEITDLDQMRAFCIAMSAALTVIVASQLGLPVSSTHIAIGGVLGVGFLREYLKLNYTGMIEEIKMRHEGKKAEEIQAYLETFAAASVEEKQTMLDQLKAKSASVKLKKKEIKRVKRMYRKELVQRSVVYKIIAAWIITVPAAGAMAAVIYLGIVWVVQS